MSKNVLVYQKNQKYKYITCRLFVCVSAIDQICSFNQQCKLVYFFVELNCIYYVYMSVDNFRVLAFGNFWLILIARRLKIVCRCFNYHYLLKAYCKPASICMVLCFMNIEKNNNSCILPLV